MWRVGLVVVAGARVASADVRPPEYPIEIVERPLVLPNDATSLEVDYQLRTHVDDVGRRSGFFDDQTPDISIAHGFGPIEAGLGIGELGYLWFSADLGGPALDLGVTFTAPQANDSYSDTQYLGIADKLVVVPGGLAVFGSLTTYINERQLADMATGKLVAIDPRTGFVLQADAHVALIGAAELELPVAYTRDLPVHTALDVTAELKVGFRRWDFYAAGVLGDVTRRERSTFLSAGFIKRWGI